MKVTVYQVEQGDLWVLFWNLCHMSVEFVGSLPPLQEVFLWELHFSLTLKINILLILIPDFDQLITNSTHKLGGII